MVAWVGIVPDLSGYSKINVGSKNMDHFPYLALPLKQYSILFPYEYVFAE